MRDIFSKLLDHPIMLFLSKLVDLFCLNVMFIITCIPIFTIGAALSALYYVCVSEWDTQNAHLVSNYFRSFKENFGQALVLWCIMLCSGSILGGITVIVFTQWKNGGGTPMTIALVVCAIFLLIYACIFTYLWPLQAKFSNTIGNTIKNAFLMSISNLPGTVVCWLLFVAIAFFTYQVDAVRIMVTLFGFSFLAFMQSKIFKTVFDPYFMEAQEMADMQLQEEIAIEMEEKEKTRLEKQQEMFARLDALKAQEAAQNDVSSRDNTDTSNTETKENDVTSENKEN